MKKIIILLVMLIVLSSVVYAADYFEEGHGFGAPDSNPAGNVYEEGHAFSVNETVSILNGTVGAGSSCDTVYLFDYTGETFPPTLLSTSSAIVDFKFILVPSIIVYPINKYLILCNRTDQASYTRAEWDGSATYPTISGYVNWSSGAILRWPLGDVVLPGTQGYNIVKFGLELAGEPGAPHDPTWVTPSVDTWNNNTNITMNISHTSSGIEYNIYLDGAPYILGASQTGDFYYSFLTNLSDGDYTFKTSVVNTTSGNSSKNVTRTWILDTVSPTITVLTNNSFHTDNSTRINSRGSNLSINISYFDAHLTGGQVVLNITNTSDGSMYSIHNISITDNYVNITKEVDISTWGLGNYTAKLLATDSHTTKEIKPYSVDTGSNYFEYNTDEGLIIKIESLESSSDINSLATAKQKDRYDFNFDFKTTKTTTTFRLTSNSKLNYIKDSQYNAHFTTFNGVNGNWIDFEGLGLTSKNYEINKVNDYVYDITLKDISMKNFEFNSIGGLNLKEEHYRFEITSEVIFWAFDISTGLIINTGEATDFNITIGGITQTGTAEAGSSFTNISRGIHQVTTTATGYDDTITAVDILQNYHNISLNMSSDTLMDNCTLWSIHTLNVTLYNVSTNTVLIGDMDFVFTYNKSNATLNYSTSVDGHGNASFCIKAGQDLIVDTLIDYTVAGTTFNYHLSDFILDNTTKLLSLYSTSGTTRVTFTVTDVFDTPIKNALVKVLKYDVGSNVFNTVEVLKTNDEGEAVGNLVLFTDFYKFIVEYNGVSYIVTEPTKIFTTTKDFRIDLSAADWFANFDVKLGVSTLLNYTPSTNNFVFTWNDPTAAMHFGCLQVVKMNRTRELTICDTCTESTSSTILCNIGANPTGRYIAQGYLKFDPTYMTDMMEMVWGEGNFTGLWEQGPEEKEFGVFISFLLIVALMMIGIFSPVAAIVMTLAGFFVAMVMGFLNLQVSALITLVLLGIIVIYRISK